MEQEKAFGSNKEARAEDLRRFWVGFEGFRMISSEKEAKIKQDLKGFCQEQFKMAIPEANLKTAVETMMLFFYGVELARRLHPELTERVPVPEYELVKEGPMSVMLAIDYDDMEGDEAVILGTVFGARFEYLVRAGDFSTLQGQRWRNENQWTVSDNLADTVIVDIVVAGVEEYGHELTVRLADSRKLRRILDEIAGVLAEYEMVRAEQGVQEADKFYHAAVIERRALIWQWAVLNAHLPSWAAPTAEFVRELRDYRRAHAKI